MNKIYWWDDNSISKEFIDLIPLIIITGEAISTASKQTLEKLVVDIAKETKNTMDAAQHVVMMTFCSSHHEKRFLKGTLCSLFEISDSLKLPDSCNKRYVGQIDWSLSFFELA